MLFTLSLYHGKAFPVYGIRLRLFCQEKRMVRSLKNCRTIHGNGPEGIRTLGLRVANAALSQLSYEPIFLPFAVVCQLS